MLFRAIYLALQLGSTISRPIGSINARSFCESCEFTRGDIRNW